MWPTFWILLGMAVLEFLVGAVSRPEQFVPEGDWVMQLILAPIGLALSFFLIGPLSLGVVQAHLKTSRGETPEWSDLGYGFSRYPQAVLVTVLSTLIVLGGFILLIIPGIFLAVRLAFTSYRFVDGDMDAMDAIKAAWEDTRGQWWRTFGFFLMTVPIAIAGLLALGVGIFVAMVLLAQASAVYYRSLAQARAAPEA